MRRLLLAMGGSEQGWSRHNDEGTFRDYDAEVARLFESAKPWGLECMKFDNDYIRNLPYYNDHRDVLDKTSFGFCFKAIGFNEAFKQMDIGDVALFVDSNHIVKTDPSLFYNIAGSYGSYIHDHIWVEYPNKYWTRRDTFVNMGCDEARYWDSLQMQCNIIAFKKEPETIDFLAELLECDLNYKIMFGENKYPNFEGFREHRHDQSIFSILREKYKFPYANRTKNHQEGRSLEFIIPEIETITPVVPVDNSHRKKADRKDIR